MAFQFEPPTRPMVPAIFSNVFVLVEGRAATAWYH
jgi:hypothetical protein